jgi:hypothetical protein
MLAISPSIIFGEWIWHDHIIGVILLDVIPDHVAKVVQGQGCLNARISNIQHSNKGTREDCMLQIKPFGLAPSSFSLVGPQGSQVSLSAYKAKNPHSHAAARTRLHRRNHLTH